MHIPERNACLIFSLIFVNLPTKDCRVPFVSFSNLRGHKGAPLSGLQLRPWSLVVSRPPCPTTLSNCNNINSAIFSSPLTPGFAKFTFRLQIRRFQERIWHSIREMSQFMETPGLTKYTRTIPEKRIKGRV